MRYYLSTRLNLTVLKSVDEPLYSLISSRELQQFNRRRRRKFPNLPDFTLFEYKNLWAVQNGRCSICSDKEKTRPLNIDHVHSTGVIRGLLCGNCNRAIGIFNDDPNLIQVAFSYLKKFE